MRGFGRVFKRGSIYWIAYNHRGREHRESAKTENESAARKFLKKRIGEVTSEKFIGPSEERLSFEIMADALVTDYEINKLRSLRSVKLSLRHLRRSFPLARAVDLTTDRIKKYMRSRQREGAVNASINRELSALKRMFKLAVESGRLRFAPHVLMLEENNARQGFVDHDVFLTVRKHLPVYLKDPVTFLYLSGWRLGEMKASARSHGCSTCPATRYVVICVARDCRATNVRREQASSIRLSGTSMSERRQRRWIGFRRQYFCAS